MLEKRDLDRWDIRLTAADEAVKVIKSGDAVAVSPQTTTPLTLCNSLFRRRNGASQRPCRPPHVQVRLG